MYRYIYIYIYVCVCVCVYIYIYIYMHSCRVVKKNGACVPVLLQDRYESIKICMCIRCMHVCWGGVEGECLWGICVHHPNIRVEIRCVKAPIV